MREPATPGDPIRRAPREQGHHVLHVVVAIVILILVGLALYRGAPDRDPEAPATQPR